MEARVGEFSHKFSGVMKIRFMECLHRGWGVSSHTGRELPSHHGKVLLIEDEPLGEAVEHAPTGRDQSYPWLLDFGRVFARLP